MVSNERLASSAHGPHPHEPGCIITFGNIIIRTHSPTFKMLRRLCVLMASLSNDDGNGNDAARKQ